MRILIVTLALVSLSSVPQLMIGQVMLLDPDLRSVSIHLEEKASSSLSDFRRKSFVFNNGPF